jgi:hypothetical protein
MKDLKEGIGYNQVFRRKDYQKSFKRKTKSTSKDQAMIILRLISVMIASKN